MKIVLYYIIIHILNVIQNKIYFLNIYFLQIIEVLLFLMVSILIMMNYLKLDIPLKLFISLYNNCDD